MLNIGLVWFKSGGNVLHLVAVFECFCKTAGTVNTILCLLSKTSTDFVEIRYQVANVLVFAQSLLHACNLGINFIPALFVGFTAGARLEECATSLRRVAH